MEGKNVGEEVKCKVPVIESWLRKHNFLYVGATRHPFIQTIRDGTVDLNSFRRWLEQDYIFVRAFVPFVASILIKAWKQSDDTTDIEVILGGISSLNDEIAWFKKEASKWGVSLSNVVPQEANLNYCRFLESLMIEKIEYTAAITAFWAVETVYQDSFAHCLEDGSETPEDLKGTCERWGCNEFRQYCQTLQSIAERRLEKAPDDVLKNAEAAFLDVLAHEVEFWNMSNRGT